MNILEWTAIQIEAEINDGGPAFPVTEHNQDGTPYNQMFGMMLRDWFAGQALAGFYTGRGNNGALNSSIEDFAVDAAIMYRIADAMIKARK